MGENVLSGLTPALANARYLRQRRPTPGAAPIVKMIQSCSSGHGWTASGTNLASSNLNDTSVSLLGSQSITMTSDGATGASGMHCDFVLPADFDASACDVRVWVKFDSIPAAKFMTLTVSNNAQTFSTVSNALNLGGQPSGVSGYYAQDNGWTIMDIPVGWFGPTFDWTTTRRLQIKFLDNGAPLTVHVGGWAFVKRDPKGRYPNGVVSLTFDDTYVGAYTIARPMMDAYGWRGTLFPILSFIGGTGYLTMQQYTDLVQLYGWESGAHASTGAIHGVGMPALTDAQRTTEIETILAWNQSNGFRTSSFAYPLGTHDPASEQSVARYFNCGRLATSSVCLETTTSPQPMRIRSPNIGSEYANLTSYLTKTAAGKGWMPITVHGIDVASPTGNDTTSANFAAVLATIASLGMEVATVGEVLANA